MNDDQTPIGTICLPYPDHAQGGMYSFMRNLRTELDARGHPHTGDLDGDYDLLVANSWMLTSWELDRAKRRRPSLKVLHRIDGSAQDYGRGPQGDLFQGFANRLADVTVFQSAYGRHATREKFPVIGQDGPVIHNPVDIERFTATGPRVALPGEVRVLFVTYSKNPMKGGPDAFRLARAHPDVQFILLGRYEDAPVADNVTLVGQVGWDVLPDYLRSADFFLMLSENETCPNVVLEAMACGLPVLYKDSGGTGELVGDSGLKVTVDDFRSVLESARPRRDALSARARNLCETRFSPGVIVDQYLAAARDATRRPLPSLVESLWHRARTRIGL